MMVSLLHLRRKILGSYIPSTPERKPPRVKHLQLTRDYIVISPRMLRSIRMRISSLDRPLLNR